MSSGEDVDRFYDLLFEMSNNIRHNILLLLLQKPERMTQISKVLDLTSPEVSRHLTRLLETMLIEKDSNNYYHVTNFGEYFINSLVDLEFVTNYRNYFLKHSAVNIPIKFQKRMSELSKYKLENNFMEFLNFINKKIESAQAFVYLFIDQYPILALDSMLASIQRGVKYKIIEPVNLNRPKKFFKNENLTSSERKDPQVELRIQHKNDAYIFISDQGSAISFPTKSGFDYTGFVNYDGNDRGWIQDLFEYYWAPAALKLIQCTLCSSPIRSEPIIETIDGKEYVFDTQKCVLTFRRLRQIYGERFE